MRFDNVAILSVSHIDAPLCLESEEIERRLAPTLSRLGFDPALLRQLSGVMRRRQWHEGTLPSTAATEAAVRAIEAAGIDRNDLGILVNGSVCRDYLEPSTACIVHGNLGLPATCMNFDVGNACLGFINGMELVATMIERRQIDHGMVVNCENTHPAMLATIKRLLDPRTTWTAFRDNFATLTLGSGAVAMILSRATGATREHRFLGGVTMAATEHCRLCTAQVDQMITNTKKLFHHGLELGLKTWEVAREVLNWRIDDIDQFVIHQVGKAHTEKFARTLGVPLSKIFRLYPNHGNIGPAGVPIALSKLVASGTLKDGNRIALMGIGSGINCSMAELMW
jgi:3-oxoacyl-[acyl-carrier-protein] synthase-3